MDPATCLTNFAAFESVPADLRRSQRDTRQYASLFPVLLEHPHGEMEHQVPPKELRESTIVLDCFEIRNPTSKVLDYPLVPSPCMCLCVKFGGDAPQAVLCGATSSLSAVSLPPGHTAFCVRFHPGVADFFTKTPAKKLTNCTFPLSVFLPFTHELIREIQFCGSFEERVRSVSVRFSGHSHSNGSESDVLLGRSMELIHQKHGVLRVAEMAEALGCSERYLCRMFSHRVGLSTKRYCELVQLQFSLQEILTKRPKTLAKTAASFGYFDQPHMNRVYQKFLGRTAGDMRYFNGISCNMSDISIVL